MIVIITNSTTVITKIMMVLPLPRLPTPGAPVEAKIVMNYSTSDIKTQMV